jgi:hypothetical protein
LSLGENLGIFMIREMKNLGIPSNSSENHGIFMIRENENLGISKL